MKKVTSLLLNDTFILSLIFFNALLIFAQGFGLAEPFLTVIVSLDDLITMIFVIELLVKIRHYGLRGYLGTKWNIFDGTLILLAVPSLFSLFLSQDNDSHMEYFLVLRVLRIFKFFRFIRYFPNIGKLMAALEHALKASVAVVFGFLIYIFVISVVSCFLYRDIAPEYFGDPLLSFYSVFRIFTVEGWYEIPDLIASRADLTVAFFTKCYFAFILITGGIFGLSLVNSIFVDAMVQDNNDELERKVEILNQKIDRLLDER